MQYRRSRATSAKFFFTIVTDERRRILCAEANVALLRDAFRYVIDQHPFLIDAFVILPEHLHCIWTLPENDNDFSTRWRLIKSYFSRKCGDEFKGLQTPNRLNKGEQAVWQHRFWEHQIRDDGDFIKHVEYIHYNPVKRGLVKSPSEWPHSTFHRYVKLGIYHADWGTNQAIIFDDKIGNE
jgi:putative transposase